MNNNQFGSSGDETGSLEIRPNPFSLPFIPPLSNSIPRAGCFAHDGIIAEGEADHRREVEVSTCPTNS